MAEERAGDWLQTVTGRQFWPFDPRPEEVDLTDVAHALAHLCRFGGHVRRFYSVAEHSVRVSWRVPPEDALGALLHDGSEAYLIDVPRPIKRHPAMAFYREAEHRLERVIFEAFGVPGMPASVERADTRMLMTEKRDLVARTDFVWTKAQSRDGSAEPFPEVCEGWSPIEARRRFLERFFELSSSDWRRGYMEKVRERAAS